MAAAPDEDASKRQKLGECHKFESVSSKLSGPHKAFSHAVRVNGVQRLVQTGTITALSPDWKVRGTTIEEQTKATLESLRDTLADAGATMDDVVSTTIYLVDISNSETVARLCEEVFTLSKPAFSLIPIKNLLLDELMLELSAIAVVRCKGDDECLVPFSSDALMSGKLHKASGAFCHVNRTNGFQRVVFTGTITALTPDWKVIGTSIEEQTRATLQCLKDNLADSGATIHDVVATTFYLVNIKDMPAVAKVREEMFEGCKPASGTIPIKNLLLPELMLEMSAVALVSPKPELPQPPVFARHNIMSPTLHKGSGAFSHSVRVDACRSFVFTSEMGAIGSDGCVVGETIEEQARVAITNMKMCLAEVGATIQDVVSTTWYLVNIDDMPAVAKVRAELFEGCKPQSGSIPIRELLQPGMKISVTAIAALPEGR